MVKPSELRCEIDGRIRDLAFEGRYAQMGDVGKGQTVIVSFPIRERTEKRRIEGYDFNFVLRGNDVV